MDHMIPFMTPTSSKQPSSRSSAFPTSDPSNSIPRSRATGSDSSGLHSNINLPSSTTMASSNSSITRSEARQNDKQKQQSQPPRVAFVPGAPNSDLYGAVNCNECTGSRQVKASTKAGLAGNTAPHLRLKSGPPLLEIRRLKYVPPRKGKSSVYFSHREEETPKSGWNDDRDTISSSTSREGEDATEDPDLDFPTRPMFQHETILVSRGIPGLGGNVSSTCLSFRPLTDQQHQNLLRMQQSKSNIHREEDSPPSKLPTVVRCATGLTSGALVIHTISNLYEGEEDGAKPTSTVAHYAPRQQRPVTSVAWCSSSSKNSRLVAIGLTGSGGSSGGAASSAKPGLAGPSGSAVTGRKTPPIRSMGGVGLGGTPVSGLSPSAGGDRDFGCLVWDIEGQSSAASGGGTAGGVVKGPGAAVPIKTPAYKYAHNTGVESVSWLLDGQLLAVGSQKRNLQLYDLRVSGTNAPPVSVFAHSEAVSGIVPDVSCPTKSVFASFGCNAGEPVKIWDARMMDSTIGEIRAGPNSGMGVSAIAWSPERAGFLSIAIGGTIRTYDTKAPGSRSLPVEVSYIGGDEDSFLQDIAFQPQVFCGAKPSSVLFPKGGVDTSALEQGAVNPFEFYPNRILVVSSKGDTDLVPESCVAPLAVSKRDGRIAHSLGSYVWIGDTTEGPSAMEGKMLITTEDISARMMRRARCLHSFRYSTDASANVKMLEDEREQLLQQFHCDHQQHDEQPNRSDFDGALADINQLTRLWRWIALVEDLCRIEQREGEDNNINLNNSSMNFGSSHSAYTDESSWTAKGLQDAGVLKLLRLSSRDSPDDNTHWMDSKSTSEVLCCDEFDSPMRRAALNACGWMKKYGALRNLLDDCESRGEFERSAALAIWHGNLGECVAALQRGADEVRELASHQTGNRGGDSCSPTKASLEAYAETLSLIAMVVAGFNMSTAADGSMKTSTVWSNACERLLLRPDITPSEESYSISLSQGISYLRAICTFLLNIGDGFNRTIYDEGLSLADRVAVATRFLSRADLRSFLDSCLRKCHKTGNLEGIIITGLDKRGVGIIQSYMDRTSDVQTAALISSRVIVPTEWGAERRICNEWLESYRSFLNRMQMWHSRAAFDVGRNEILRRLNSTPSVNVRRAVSSKKAQRVENDPVQFPPQLWARCNYCNSSLPLSKLRRQEGIVANSWLSRQKPVLTCCPTCKKPLPRCSICLLSLGCLNPYMELQRERNQLPRGGGPMIVGGGSDDLSGLANIPFAEWFTWCMRCKHGGHAHHLVGWFSKHPTCAVSGCDCHCQFDGIEKLKRPALSTQPKKCTG
eukprot:CCRYP_017117-RA/>CCRYP_017117-RA protein AED:0.04 eAED:0.04 QI:260/1/1/1/0.83/0.85/7/841/1309